MNNKCPECKSSTVWDGEMQDYVCSNSECQCWLEIGNDLAFDDCRKCGSQCRQVYELDEFFAGLNYNNEPQYREGRTVTLVCNACQNELVVCGEDAEYFLNLHV
jgi:hypothetical protein